jgi:hypothetical protein
VKGSTGGTCLATRSYSGLGSATKAGVSFYATPLARCFVRASFAGLDGIIKEPRGWLVIADLLA